MSKFVPSVNRPSKRIKGEVRRSQIITTYGVGSIVPALDESFMVAGLEKWNFDEFDLHEPRLQRKLGKLGFVLPPSNESRYRVPVTRFPTFVYCSQCGRLDKYTFFANTTDNRCPKCKAELIPSRFVMVCAKGHIDDFPYFNWVHKGTPMGIPGEKHELTIKAGGASASLSDVVIQCSCGKASTMKGAFAKTALKDVSSCTRARPWLGDAEETCTEIPRTLQRGASNVYFPEVASALSIPPWSEAAFKVLNRHWAVFKVTPEDVLEPMIQAMNLVKNTGFTVADLVLAVKQRKRQETEGVDPGSQNLLFQEYEALLIGKAEVDAQQDFVCVESERGTGVVSQFLAKVMAVKRLREVRVLTAFTRLTPPDPSTSDDYRTPLSKEPKEWLPGMEVKGEGVFFQLDPESLQLWESLPNVVARAEKINRNYLHRCAAFGKVPDKILTPRLILIHTLAHILINEWALDSGYPAASLRERLYVSDEMIGLLIYTATSDAAGSLGGLTAQADWQRLEMTLKEAVHRAAWCSADPLCIEADAAGVDSLNLAACHACVLLPETSCELSNTFLDRALLVGTPSDASLGFFSQLLKIED